MSLAIEMQQLRRAMDEARGVHEFRRRVATDQLGEIAYLWQDSRGRRFFPQYVETQADRARDLSRLHEVINRRAGDVASALHRAEEAAAMVAVRLEEAQLVIARAEDSLRTAEDLVNRAESDARQASDTMGSCEALLASLA